MAVGLPVGRAAARLRGGVPDDVVRDEQVQPAIVVVIQPAGRYRPHAAELRVGSGDAGLRGDVGEAAVAEVAVEGVALHAGDEDIGVAVVVEVADGDGRGIAFAGEARLGGDVGERHVAVIAKQAVIEFGAGLAEAGNGGAIGEEDVGAAVVVVVENGDAAGREFDLVELARGAVAQFESQAGLWPRLPRNE